MNRKTNSTQRKKMFYLILPMGVMPVMLLMGWIFGDIQAQDLPEKSGINILLPEVAMNAEQDDKWNSYLKAEQEEKKLKEAIKMDPYSGDDRAGSISLPALHTSEQEVFDIQERQIEERLQKLNAILEAPAAPIKPKQTNYTGLVNDQSSASSEIARLEALMEKMSGRHSEPDEELVQLESLLDKIIEIQHPERSIYLEDQLKRERKEVFPVTYKRLAMDNSLKSHSSTEIKVIDMDGEQNGFFGLEANNVMDVEILPAISAIVAEDKELGTGGSIKLELSEEVIINGLQFDLGSELFGVCSLEGERLKISVNSLRHGKTIVPVNLEVYGLDAMAGLAVPGAIARNAVKEGATGGMQGYNPVQPGFSLETQLTATGVETAKSFLSKKSRLVKVYVKAGHPLLLVDKA